MSTFERLRSYFRRDKFITHTYPLLGSLGYCAYSTNFLAPREFSSVFGDKSVMAANVLLCNSALSHFLWINTSKHLTNVKSDTEGYLYSLFVSVIFNFGSILLWCLSKIYLPDNNVVRVSYGLATSMALLYVGKSYFSYIDSQV